MHNLTETEEWATVQAIQDGDALSNANLEPTAQKLLNRTAYLHGAHRIQQLQLATGGTADSTNQNIAGGATYTALTGCSATLTNAKAGDVILVAAQLGFCDNARQGPGVVRVDHDTAHASSQELADRVRLDENPRVNETELADGPESDGQIHLGDQLRGR